MKKLFTLIISAIVINYSASGQAVPNSGFEIWTSHSNYDDPNGWSTLNSTTSILGIVTVSKSTDAHSGTYSLRGETKFVGSPFNIPAPALVTTGTINTNTQSADGGIAYTLRPDSIAGWMKYTPVNSDTGYMEVLLMNAAATDTVGRAKFFQTSATDWKRFSAAFVYFSQDPVELSRVNLLPSSGYVPQVGSVVQFDDLEFILITGINEKEGSLNFSVSPNPATEELFIKNPYNETAKMLLFDITGKKVNEINIGLNTTKTNIATYSPGVYLYSFVNKNSEILYKGKLVITR